MSAKDAAGEMARDVSDWRSSYFAKQGAAAVASTMSCRTVPPMSVPALPTPKSRPSKPFSGSSSIPAQDQRTRPSTDIGKPWIERHTTELNLMAEANRAKAEASQRIEQRKQKKEKALRMRALTNLWKSRTAAQCQCCDPSADSSGTQDTDCDGRNLGQSSPSSPSRRSSTSMTAEQLLEEPGGNAMASRVRQNLRSIAQGQLDAAASVRAAKQRQALQEKRKSEARARILERAKSAPALDTSGLNVERAVEDEHDVCEGCRSEVSLRGEICSYYLCLTCLCQSGIRSCLCPACYEVQDLVHDVPPDSDGKQAQHSFCHSDTFLNYADSHGVPTALNMPKIDFHQHCRHEDQAGLEELLKTNAEWNVERCVLLALRPLIGSTRDEVMRRNDWVLLMARTFPQVVPFVTIIEDDPMSPRMFVDCLEKGAKGLKLIGWHSAFIEKYDYDLCNPALMEVYRIAAARSVPVLAHVFVGMSGAKRDYAADIDTIMTSFPRLRFVLAHLGLGFDEGSLPSLEYLAEKHRRLYFDTSFYGGYKEVWFSRVSNRADVLKRFVLRFPRQVLFGSDVFADSRHLGEVSYSRALRSSASLLQFNTFACLEFRRTDHFEHIEYDKFGPVNFDPLRLRGLDLAGNQEVLRRCIRENAMEVLGLKDEAAKQP